MLKIQLFCKSSSSEEVSKRKKASCKCLGSFLLQSANLVLFRENLLDFQQIVEHLLKRRIVEQANAAQKSLIVAVMFTIY